MRQIVYLKDLSVESGRNLVEHIRNMQGVESVISSPQIRDKRSCMVDTNVPEDVISQLQSLGYKTYTPQGESENVSQTRIN